MPSARALLKLPAELPCTKLTEAPFQIGPIGSIGSIGSIGFTYGLLLNPLTELGVCAACNEAFNKQ